jgi:CCR4-NOT transcription complex subunit 3
MYHPLETAESDSQASYTPRTPYVGHPSFPQNPLSNTEYTTLFGRLPADTLFYAFYHQQETYQQYLAARQLKKQSWRFHKKYMTWFQRHEEPKVKKDDYEEGTYAFFDYEGGWCTRYRSDFKFEFAYLEDELPGAK